MVYTLKWWPGSCQFRRVRHACTELHTQLIWVEDAHQDAHVETDKTQTQTQTRTWRRSFSVVGRGVSARCEGVGGGGMTQEIFKI